MGYIYKITTPHSTQCYVGKTKNYLSNRFGQHKCDYRKYLNGQFNFISSFKLLELGNCKIECLEVVQDEDKLPEREQYWFRQFDCVNKCVPNRTHKERSKNWREQNPEKVKETQKNWREQNAEKLNQKYTCEICDGSYTHANKSAHFKTKKHREACEGTSTA